MAPELMKKDLAVVAIHLGQDDVRDYLKSHNIDLLSVVDADFTVGQAYNVHGVPKMVLVGEDGRIERSHSGMADEATLRAWGGD